MKSLMLILLAIMLLGDPINAQTSLTGDFYNDDTLRKSQSPYIVSNNLVVFQNVTLYIEPGTKILFNEKSITVRGNLIAEGTINDSIVFSSQNTKKGKAIIVQENDKSYDYQIYLKYCVGENFEDFLSVDRNDYWLRGKFFMQHCNFRYNKTVFVVRPYTLDSMNIDRCTFYKNTTCLKSNFDKHHYYRVTNSRFIDNGIGVIGGEIDSCFFTGHSVFAVQFAYIKNSILYNNSIGIDGEASIRSLVENNEIIYNDIGANLAWDDDLPNGNVFFKNNRICHNRTWNIRNNSVHDGSVLYTCWCSADSVAIRATIRDGYIDNQYGRMFFTNTDTCEPSMTAPDTSTLSIEDKNLVKTVRLFPNPVTSQAVLQFDYSDENEYVITIKDITGKVVRVIDDIYSGYTLINTTDLSPGLYMVVLRTETEMISVQKMVVQ